MYPSLRSTGRFATWAILTLVLFVAAALLVLQTSWAKAHILDEITERANASIAGELQADRLSGPVLWGVTLHDVRLRDRRGGPVFRADEIEVGYSPCALLGDDLRIGSVGLARPLMLARRYPDGGWNLAELTAAELTASEAERGDPDASDIEVGRYRIEQGGFVYEDRSDLSGKNVDETGPLHNAVSDLFDGERPGGDEDEFVEVREEFTTERDSLRVAVADDVGFGGSFQVHADGTTEVSIDGADFAVAANMLDEPMPLATDGLHATYGPERLGLTVEKFRVGRDSTLEALEGKAELAAPDGTLEEISGDVGSVTVTPSLAARVAPSLPLAAPVTAGGRVFGPADELTFEGSVSVPDGGSVAVDGRLDATVPNYRVKLKSPELKPAAWVASGLPEMVVDAEGLVDGEGASLDTMQTRVRLTGVDGRVGYYRFGRLLVDTRIGAGSPYPLVELTTLELESPYLEASGDGQFGAEGDFEFHVDGQTPEEGLPDELAAWWNMEPEQLGGVGVSADASGGIAVDAARSADMLRRLEVSASWEMGTVALETAKVDASQGSLELEVSPGSAGEARDLEMQTVGSFEALALPSYTLDAGQWTATGRGRLAADAESVVDGFSSLTMDGNLDFAGLAGDDLEARDGDASLQLERASSSAPIGYELDAGLAKAGWGKYSARRFDLAFTGDLPEGAWSSDETVGTLTTTGDVSGAGASGPEMGARKFAADVTFEGAPMVPGESLDYEVDGTAGGVEYGDYTADQTRFDLAGGLVAAEGDERSVETFSAAGTVGGTGLESGSWRFSDFDADVSFDGPPMVAGESIQFDIDATAGRPEAWLMSADELSFAAEGTATPAGEEAKRVVESVATAGGLDLEGLQGFGLDSDLIETDFELDGPLDDSEGFVRTAIESIGVGELDFGVANLDLELKEDRNFRFVTEAAPALVPDLPFIARLAGSYAKSASPFLLETLELGRPGVMWKMPSPGRVVLEGDDRVTFDSMGLRGFGEWVELDGNHSVAGVENVSQLVDRLGLSRLGGVFDPEILRERLPEKYRDRVPQEVLEAPEDAARDRLRDEVEKRAPDADKLLDGL